MYVCMYLCVRLSAFLFIRVSKSLRDVFYFLLLAFTDREIECKDCGDMFIFSAKEQSFYQKRGFSDMVRCKSCIQSKRERMAVFDRKGVTNIDDMNKTYR